MAEFGGRPAQVVFNVVVGLTYVVVGLLVLIAQVNDVRIQWSVIAPTALVLLGLGLLVTAALDKRLTRASRRL